MINMRLSDIERDLGGQLSGTDGWIRGCDVDSRRLPARALFVALQGQNHDGHRFIVDAQVRGAAGVMVEEEKASRTQLPRLKVANTRFALGELAHVWRQRFQLPVVAVTGSNGKTTVKELIAGILRQAGPTLATAGNFNNDIGVPLTLFGLGDQHDFACIEMGANRAGEIARLTAIAEPTVGVITQCGAAHLEGFGSLEGVARAKGELFRGLAPSATAIINADDHYASLLTEFAGDRCQLTFGLSRDADIWATWHVAAQGTVLEIRTPAGATEVRFALAGRHNVQNALAATGAALAIGLPLEVIRRGLEAARSVPARMERKPGLRGIVIIDDTYNANPSSLGAALEVLAASEGRHWLVLGDMGELGPEAPELHQRAGEIARRQGVERLYALGALGRIAAEAFGAGSVYCESHAALIEALREDIFPGLTLLVKGSRSMRMEEIVTGLTCNAAEQLEVAVAPPPTASRLTANKALPGRD
jgi:UDP-N-acetylmuramoyl-tripeptide--D-alanyl-D-alanine ligase